MFPCSIFRYTKDSIIYMVFFILSCTLLPMPTDLWCSLSFLPVLEHSALGWNPFGVGFCLNYWCWIFGRIKCDTLDAGHGNTCILPGLAQPPDSESDEKAVGPKVQIRAKVTLQADFSCPASSPQASLGRWVALEGGSLTLGDNEELQGEKQLLWQTLALVKVHTQNNWGKSHVT